MQRLNPDYVGFRGYDNPAESSGPPLEKVTCSRCGRVRNVPVGVAAERGDDYVCATCQEELEEESGADVESEEAEESTG
jgi:DNA-directed RNA polymerase subunit RPC12/RpoP